MSRVFFIFVFLPKNDNYPLFSLIYFAHCFILGLIILLLFILNQNCATKIACRSKYTQQQEPSEILTDLAFREVSVQTLWKIIKELEKDILPFLS